MDSSVNALEAIVLAGGRGTRLGPLTEQAPKPLLPVAGRPFLAHVLRYLGQQQVGRVVLAIGYLGDQIQRTFGTRLDEMEIAYSVEHEPLGTGGAIRQALDLCQGEHVVIVNGDTFFGVDLPAFHSHHARSGRDLTLAVKHLPDSARYGAVEAVDGHVSRFREKGVTGPGFINGGIYALRRQALRRLMPAQPFSFETTILQEPRLCSAWGVFESKAYFIDIGVPADYEKAQTDFSGGLPA